MKKLFFMLLLLAATVIPTQAQTSLVATLVHEGNISTFYSANALKEAYAAAVDGDVISLSAGTFNATNITKRITLRGAGCELDNNPTILAGIFEIKNASDANLELPFLMEGIRTENFICRGLTNATFLKCEFEYRDNSDSIIGDYSLENCLDNVRFLQCIIGRVYVTFGNMTFQNCAIAQYNSDQSCAIEMNNCAVVPNYIESVKGATCTNTIIKSRNAGIYFNAKNSRFINCVIISSANAVNAPNVNCKFYDNHEFDPFENGYHLKAEYASEWLGNDGTQVGIYGGSMPYDPATTNPQISKFNVSPKTTADGKLSVDIEVKAE